MQQNGKFLHTDFMFLVTSINTHPWLPVQKPTNFETLFRVPKWRLSLSAELQPWGFVPMSTKGLKADTLLVLFQVLDQVFAFISP